MNKEWEVWFEALKGDECEWMDWLDMVRSEALAAAKWKVLAKDLDAEEPSCALCYAYVCTKCPLNLAGEHCCLHGGRKRPPLYYQWAYERTKVVRRQAARKLRDLLEKLYKEAYYDYFGKSLKAS